MSIILRQHSEKEDFSLGLKKLFNGERVNVEYRLDMGDQNLK